MSAAAYPSACGANSSNSLYRSGSCIFGRFSLRGFRAFGILGRLKSVCCHTVAVDAVAAVVAAVAAAAAAVAAVAAVAVAAAAAALDGIAGADDRG